VGALRSPALVLLVLAGLLAPASATADPAARCSLAWPDIVRNFGPGSGWQPAGPPVALQATRRDPAFQAQLFASSEDDGEVALVIAEWGDPDSPDLGSPVYCSVHDADGHVVEEVGIRPAGGDWPGPTCETDNNCA
jgi:hypothetical protein